ncbi:uncharacterized protein LOC133711584 [Rosa rugosa]|uniref:uncharacterized protein LOC133711584 n=1 Tax=Rosa rugosa TaxID=74645 RepID=UPI002B404A20|nr:uncharacterized protein LOC133711584 [Rosa rugosa]
MKSKGKEKSQSLVHVSNFNLKGKVKGTCTSRAYLSWNKEMDNVLAKVLYDQMNAGHKADGDWKPQAYQAVVDKLNTTWQLGLTKLNVTNRLKAWKRHYAIITDIRSQSGLVWDEEKKMVPITAENLEIWNAYVESHPSAKGYQNKSIENWDDIAMLCGKDKTTGEGAEDVGDAEETMEFEAEDESDVTPNSHASTHAATSNCDPHPPNKTKKKDPLAQAIGDVANTLKEFMAAQVSPQLKGEDVHEVVSKVPNLSKLQVFKAVRILMSGNLEEFSLLKSINDAEKNEWIRMLIWQYEGFGISSSMLFWGNQGIKSEYDNLDFHGMELWR